MSDWPLAISNRYPSTGSGRKLRLRLRLRTIDYLASDARAPGISWRGSEVQGFTNTEPGADRGPQAGSPLGVVEATGSATTWWEDKSAKPRECTGRKIRPWSDSL